MSQIPLRELVYFSLPSWYLIFRHVTIKSEFIELPQKFVDYLMSDGVVLPQGCQLPSIQQDKVGEEEEGSDRWSEEDSPQPDDAAVETPPSFPEEISRITAAISALGGKGVVPKLNWSAPRDAVWISATNSLCCSSPAEVLLLLKSSDFVAHDISRISEINAQSDKAQSPLQCTLCLRQWRDIRTSSEFRCFVRDRQVIGACQRDSTTHFPFLLSQRERILGDLLTFHLRHLRDTVSPANYVFDVFLKVEGDFVLLDLNPFCSLTDALLYSWEELEAWQGGEVELRLVESGGIQPSQHQSYRLPKDIVDLSTGEDITKFVDLFQSKALERS